MEVADVALAVGSNDNVGVLVIDLTTVLRNWEDQEALSSAVPTSGAQSVPSTTSPSGSASEEEWSFPPNESNVLAFGDMQPMSMSDAQANGSIGVGTWAQTYSALQSSARSSEDYRGSLLL